MLHTRTFRKHDLVSQSCLLACMAICFAYAGTHVFHNRGTCVFPGYTTRKDLQRDVTMLYICNHEYICISTLYIYYQLVTMQGGMDLCQAYISTWDTFSYIHADMYCAYIYVHIVSLWCGEQNKSCIWYGPFHPDAIQCQSGTAAFVGHVPHRM